jgi:hypothetical protein
VPTGKETTEWEFKLVQPEQILSYVIIDFDTGDIHRQKALCSRVKSVRLRMGKRSDLWQAK